MSRYDGHTPGPWMWWGNVKGLPPYLRLATERGGRLLVMDGEGRQSVIRARFRENGLMRGATCFARPDHNGEFFEIDHPDARLIADSWRIPQLEGRIEEMEAAHRHHEETIPHLQRDLAAARACIRDLMDSPDRLALLQALDRHVPAVAAAMNAAKASP